MSGLLWFILLLNAYLLLLFILVKTGWMTRLNMSLFGPALMIKTERGQGLLNWFARAKRTFDGSAAIGVWLTGVLMLLMTVLIIVQVPFVLRLKPEQVPPPSLILGIPGINPVIPLGFGIIALIFAVVVHEFSHGILARVHGLRVKTMGLLFLIVPIGAFVEPDEEELKAAPRKQRLRVFAAGPMSNIFFAVVFGFLFSGVLMGSAHPVAGVPIQTIVKDGPADLAGLRPGDIITHVNETAIRTPEDFTAALVDVPPNTTITMRTQPDGATHQVTTVPCHRLGQNTNETCRLDYPNHPDPSNRTLIGVRVYPTDLVYGWLRHPFSSLGNFAAYMLLPLTALYGDFPLVGIYQDFYEVPFDPGTFWFLANLAFWLFWINLMLGMTNALPMVPLDGGHVFRDFLGAWVEKLSPKSSPERREKVVKGASNAVALVMLALVLMQFFGPYLMALFV